MKLLILLMLFIMGFLLGCSFDPSLIRQVTVVEPTPVPSVVVVVPTLTPLPTCLPTLTPAPTFDGPTLINCQEPNHAYSPDCP